MCQKLQYFTNRVYSSKKSVSNINQEKCLEKITCLKLNFIRGGINPSPAWFQLYPLQTLSSKSCYQHRRFHSVCESYSYFTHCLHIYLCFTVTDMATSPISNSAVRQSGCKRTQKILNKICGESGNYTLKYAILDLVENM